MPPQYLMDRGNDRSIVLILDSCFHSAFFLFCFAFDVQSSVFFFGSIWAIIPIAQLTVKGRSALSSSRNVLFYIFFLTIY